jgi:hypothetical protein
MLREFLVDEVIMGSMGVGRCVLQSLPLPLW